MTTMTDHANISLKVARIIHPDAEWEEYGDGAHAFCWSDPFFDYRTDTAGFQMVLYLSEFLWRSVQGKPTQQINGMRKLKDFLHSDNPNLALATAIIELKENG